MALAFTSGSSGGGSGTVKSVTAGDTSVVVGGTATDPTVETADLSTIAADHATAGDVALNSKKITGLANGTAATDAAAFGQIPAALPPSGAAGGDLAGTYPSPTVKALTETSGPTDLVIGAITDGQFLKRVGSTLVSAAGGTGTVTSVTAADTSIVVSGTGAAPTVRTATLDVIAADHPAAADWSNNSHKITSVTDPSGAQDAATKHYVDSVVPGNAGGKGHLTTATAANTPADLAPGADGTVLTVDSAQSTGLAWKASTKQVPIRLTAPDASGNAYAALTTGAGTNIRELVPAFTKSVDGFWWGVVRVPLDYGSAGKVLLSIAANATTGNTRLIVSSLVVANGVSYDQALTAETVQTITVPGTAFVRSDVTFTLSTTPTGGADLLVNVERNGSNVGDTLAVDLLMANCIFQYST